MRVLFVTASRGLGVEIGSITARFSSDQPDPSLHCKPVLDQTSIRLAIWDPVIRVGFTDGSGHC